MPETDPQRRTRRWKRTAAAALLLLAGGAVVNVAVAWTLSLTINPYTFSYTVSGDRITQENRFWSAWTRQQMGAMSLRAHIDLVHDGHVDRGENPEEFLPRWWRPGRFIDLPSPEVWSKKEKMKAEGVEVYVFPFDELVQFYSYAEARGWPMHSMWYELRYGAAFDPEVTLQAPGAIELPLPAWTYSTAPGAVGDPRALPLRIIPLGFAINTLFYALLLWLLFFAPFAARRILRRRRGLCEKCAYPIGVSPVCTECGAAVRLRWHDRFRGLGRE